MKKFKHKNIQVISGFLILSFLAMTLFLAPELFTSSKVTEEHPIRYKKTICDFTTVETSPDIMKKMVQIHSFLDDTLKDDEEVLIEEILVNSMNDTTINKLILDMHSVGLLETLLARYDEEAIHIRKDQPGNNTLTGVIKNALFDYPVPTFNSTSHSLFDKIMSANNLSYEAAKSFFYSYVFYDTVNLIQNRSDLYHLLSSNSNFNDFSIGVLQFTFEEINQIEPYQGRDAISKNNRLSEFKDQLKGFLDSKKDK